MNRISIPTLAASCGLATITTVASAQISLVPAGDVSVKSRAAQPVGANILPGTFADNDKNGEPQGFVITVLHHNDGESQLLGLAGNPDFGGIDRFATKMAQLRADALVDDGSGLPRGVLVINAGDTFLPGPEFNASIDNGIPYFDALALDAIGYDAFIIGNHEFDFGPGILANFINSFTTPPPFLSANLDVTPEPALAPLAPAVIGSSVVLTVAGQQVAIVGATTETLPFVTSPGLVGIDADVAGAIQAEVDLLTSMDINTILVGSHLQGLDNDAAVIAQLDNVDAFIGGGGGGLLANPSDLLVPGDAPIGAYPQIVADLDGTGVPSVTTPGDYAYIGALELVFDADGNLMSSSGSMNRVSGIGPDAVAGDPFIIDNVVTPVAAAVEALGQNVIASITSTELDGRRVTIRSRETSLGNLVADSQLWAAQTRAAGFGAPVADIAVANGGGIRNDSVIPSGDFTELDTFDILPFSNTVGVVEGVTPQRLKEVMENAVSAIEGGSGRFAQISGFSMVVDPDAQPQRIDADTGAITQAGERVVSIVLDNGRPIVWNGMVVPGDALNLSIVNFLAGGGDQYPLADLPYTLLGVSYQRALFEYVTDELGGVISGQDVGFGIEGQGRIVFTD
jgi:5'-nucleotidase/UDP-sugar diphosphatase